jgi:hypothetical protein
MQAEGEVLQMITGINTNVHGWQTSLSNELWGLHGSISTPMNELINLWDLYWIAVQGPGGMTVTTPGGSPLTNHPTLPGQNGWVDPKIGPETAEGNFSMDSYVPGDNSESTGETYVEVNINGVQNVDRLLADLRRRGINLKYG